MIAYLITAKALRDLAFRSEIVGPDVIEVVDLVSREKSVDSITRSLSRMMASSSSSYTAPDYRLFAQIT
jgi:hypothetical protein